MNSKDEILAWQGETVVKFHIDRRENETLVDVEFNNTTKRQRKSMAWRIEGKAGDIVIIDSMMNALQMVRGKIYVEHYGRQKR